MKLIAIGDFHGKFPEKLKKLVRKEKPDLILSTGDYTGIDDWRPIIKKQFQYLKRGKEFNAVEYLGEKKYKRLLKKDYDAGKKVLKDLNRLGIKVFSVFGNGDWYKTFFNDVGKFYEKEIKKLRNIKNINRGKSSFKGLNIVGFGGYLDPDIYFNEKWMKNIDEGRKKSKKRKKRYEKWEKELMRLMKSKPEILLSHYTPYRCLDRKDKSFPFPRANMGVSSFNRAIKRYKPILMVCGHMHENQGTCKIGRTLVVNPGAAVDGKSAVIEIDSKKGKVRNVKFVR